jgi:RND superfamily putative drug exporter
LKDFPGGDAMPAMLVVSRIDGSPLTPSDLDGLAVSPPSISPDGRAAVAPIPVAATSGAELNKAVAAVRTSTAARLAPGVAAELTGVPAFGADIGNAMASANIMLLAVTASVVAVLLVVTYRSPIL